MGSSRRWSLCAVWLVLATCCAAPAQTDDTSSGSRSKATDKAARKREEEEQARRDKRGKPTGDARETGQAKTSDKDRAKTADEETGAQEKEKAPEQEEAEKTKPPTKSVYPPRPEVAEQNAQIAYVLDQIEGELKELVPLYGQRAFWQAIINRALQEADPRRGQVAYSPPPSYRLLPGDQFQVTFWNPFVTPEQRTVTVQADGTVVFDPIGAVAVAGMTAPEFTALLTNLIRRKGPRDATVQIQFTSLHSLRVSVGGEVRRPSPAVLLDGYATLMDAVTAAGGPAAYASLRHIRLHRGQEVQEVDLYRFLMDGDPQANPALRDGDSVHLPVADRLVAVTGEVVRPARYELVGEQTVREALAMAGGVRGQAARVQVSVVRDYRQELLFDYDVGAVLDGSADTHTVEPLSHGAVILVLPVAARQSIKVDGAVGRPGEYGYTAGMTLGEAVAKAQGIKGGHVAVGLVRRTRPDGGVESINFEVAELASGGPAAKIPLQPDDEVLIPLFEERPPITVVVEGAVNEPGDVTVTSEATVSDLLLRVRGLAPDAASVATLLSIVEGHQVETRIDLSDLTRGGQPKPNPSLANGDRLVVPRREQVGLAPKVTVLGPVRNPNDYELTRGMRLSDLLERAGGLLPEASRHGKLTRTMPGDPVPLVLYVDFAKAASGEAKDNPALQDADVVEVLEASATVLAIPARVTVTGPVAKPGIYPRSQSMTVKDLIREAGNLRLEADRDTAYVVRQGAEGRARRIRINPARALGGDPNHDLVLENGDILELVPWREIRASRGKVSVEGAVFFPGEYELSEGMTLEDLLFLAAGATPDAYLPRAEVKRLDQGGRTRMVPVDLSLRPLLMPLMDGDQVTVYTHAEAVYREPSVEIKGSVQRPGQFERGVGMRLSDLIFQAGGLTRNVDFTACEVARARDTQVVILKPDLVRLLKGDESQNIELQDGDSVYIQTVGEYRHLPREVLVRGQVRLPGFFPLSDETETIKSLLDDRAKGLLEGAFVEGAVLLRRVDEVVSPEFARFGNEIYSLLQLKKERDDFLLILTRNSATTVPSLPKDDRILPTQILSEGNLPPSLLSVVVPTEKDMPRKPPSTDDLPPELLKRYVRVAVDLRANLEGRDHLRLRPNDILIIPEEPELVLVQGEVAGNMAQPYAQGRTVAHYLERAGGVTRDADTARMLILRANGSLTQVAGNTVVRRGDMILIPPKPITIKRETRPLEDVQVIASILGGLATTFLALSQAVK